MYRDLSDNAWLLDLGFLTDIMAKENELNRKLRERDRNLSHMISAVNVFKLKLSLWSSQFKEQRDRALPKSGENPTKCQRKNL